jgi:hypothetical protein
MLGKWSQRHELNDDVPDDFGRHSRIQLGERPSVGVKIPISAGRAKPSGFLSPVANLKDLVSNAVAQRDNKDWLNG